MPYVHTLYFAVLFLLFAYAFFVTGRRWCVGLFWASTAFSLYENAALVVITIFKNEMSRGFKQFLFATNAVLEYLDLCLYLIACILLIKLLTKMQAVGNNQTTASQFPKEEK